MLYLESGCLPIRFIISSRRLIYLQTIVKRNEEELTNRILKAQISQPSPGDFIKLVENDFENVELPFDLNLVERSSVSGFKQLVKKTN